MSKLYFSAGIALAMGLIPVAHADLAISIGIREQDAVGGADGPIGSDGGGTGGGIEWVDRDEQILVLDGTWQQFTFTILTADLQAFAGVTANSILDGSFGTLEHLRVRNIGGVTNNITLWIDDVTNTITPPGAPQMSVNFGDFEGWADGTQVIFNEPGFSGSTQANLMPGSTAGVDNSIAFTGSASYAFGLQFVDNDPERWARITTFGADNTPNPLIRFDQQSVVTFWMRGVPTPGAALLLGVAGLLGGSRRRQA